MVANYNGLHLFFYTYSGGVIIHKYLKKVSLLQKAHVQQFVPTEDALNKAAEAKNMIQQLLKHLRGTGDEVASHSLVSSASSQNLSSLRQLEVQFCFIALFRHFRFS